MPIALLFVCLIATIALIAVVIIAPGITGSKTGKVLAFVALFALPVTMGFFGVTEHMERSKQTGFCLSCHIMQPYGRSLYVDDPSYLPASHFQNARIPRDQACYTCHTNYAMYGDIKAKLHGLRHVYVQYLSTPTQSIRLYEPYNNRECLHCHLGARSFEEGTTHGPVMDDIKSNQLSCVSSGCHDLVHNVGHLDHLKYWSPQP